MPVARPAQIAAPDVTIPLYMSAEPVQPTAGAALTPQAFLLGYGLHAFSAPTASLKRSAPPFSACRISFQVLTTVTPNNEV